jgi:CTP synthase
MREVLPRESPAVSRASAYGFQIAVVEFARSVLGLEGASSTEIDHDTPHPVIDVLPEQKKIEGLGGNMRLGGQDVVVTPGSRLSRLYGDSERIRLRFRHRYEVDPDYVERIEAAGLKFSGRAEKHPIMQVLELPQHMHPFFVGGQFHPELNSRPLNPAPMFMGLTAAAIRHAYPEVATGQISNRWLRNAEQPAGA